MTFLGVLAIISGGVTFGLEIVQGVPHQASTFAVIVCGAALIVLLISARHR
ncbi:hypothetical protein [Burkholderia ambifaria]|nr:hypothetical protein [Burkholderia ambifaria]